MIYTTSNVTNRMVAVVSFLLAAFYANAAEVVYRIVEYNKSAAEFVLAGSGTVPKGSWAYFENDYGATTGNRYNQIPCNRKAVLHLGGWQGCKVRSITLGMCSNNGSGQVGLSLYDGDTKLWALRPCDFASDQWFGQWVSKDLNVYVDVTKSFDVPTFANDEASIEIQGGTAEGSVYVNTITIDYDECPGMAMESPLGWIYERLAKKDVLNDGDEVMIYRNGCAAADLGGMQESHYLDVVSVASTTDVTSPDVLRFTLRKADTAGQWTLTDQYGRVLGATAKQSLAWDEGSMLWSVTLGYDGATITNVDGKCGSLRYNAPEASYARFNVYTSTSMPLPFLYRKTKQREPILSSSLAFDETDIAADIAEGHLALHPTMLPAAVTDKRIDWVSSDEGVATVNGGFVTLLAPGQTVITARAHDGASEASVRLTVSGTNAIDNVQDDAHATATRKVLGHHGISIVTPRGRYGVGGVLQQRK